MAIDVRMPATPADRKSAGTARGRFESVHEKSEHAVEWVAFDGKRAVAGLAWIGSGALDGESPWSACLQRLQAPAAPAAIGLVQSLWFDPAACSGEAARRLVEFAMDKWRAEGVEIVLLAVPPHMVGHAEILGFRRLGETFGAGPALRLAMALVTGDWAHLARVRSPMLAAAQQQAPNYELPDWFDRYVREYHRPAAVRAQATELFLEQFAHAWGMPAAPLLDDLGEDHLERLRAFAQDLAAEPGQVLLRKRQGDRDLYLILEGAVEVSDQVRGEREVLATLGPGQIFGEGGFFASTPRSADVTAIAPTRLLELAPAAFDLLARQDPQAAIEVLRALGRALCLRVYAGIAD